MVSRRRNPCREVAGCSNRGMPPIETSLCDANDRRDIKINTEAMDVEEANPETVVPTEGLTNQGGSTSGTRSSKKRGPTMGKKTRARETRVHVGYDDNGCWITGANNELGSFVGCVARVSNLLPIDYRDWNTLPQKYKDSAWTEIEKEAEDNRLNALAQKYPHTLGRKSTAKKRREHFEKYKIQPTKATMWIESRRQNEKNGGGFIPQACSKIAEIQRLQQASPSEDGTGEVDILSEVLGKERHGRVRTMGWMATRANTLASRQHANNEQVQQMAEEITSLKTQLQEMDEVKAKMAKLEDVINQLMRQSQGQP